MNEKYKPPLDFVSKVMAKVYSYEASKASFLDRLGDHPVVRCTLVAGGTLFGIFKAASAF